MAQTEPFAPTPPLPEIPQKPLAEVTTASISAGSDEEQQQPQQQNGTGITPVPLWQFTCLSISLGIGLFLSFMDGSITSTAIYSIGAEFGELTKVTWVALAYTLADVGLAIVFTSLANIIGRFNAYLVAQFIFFAFSFGSGFAQSLDQLIACRCLQGVGGSGLYTIALVIWQETSSGNYRQAVGGAIGLCIGAGGVMGPILGGIITGNASWRWIFWINPPIMVISTVLFVTTFPHGAGRLRGRDLESARKIDYVGTLLLIGGSVLPCFALMHAAEKPGTLGTAQFIGPIVSGGVCWILLVTWGKFTQLKMPGRFESAFPPHLFKNRRFSAGCVNSLLQGFGFVITIFNIPLRMQTVHGKGPLMAGVTLLPLLTTSAIGSVMGTALSPKKDRLCPTIMAGSALMALGTGLLSTLGSSKDSGSKIYGYQVFVGFGFGMTASAATIIANMESKKKDHAVAQGITAAARVLGGAVGLSAATLILGNRVKSRLTFLPVEDAANPATHLNQLTPVQAAAVRLVYSESFNLVFFMSAMVAVGAFLSACLAYNTSTECIEDRLAHTAETLAEQREQQPALTEINVSHKASFSHVSTEKGPGSSTSSDKASNA